MSALPNSLLRQESREPFHDLYDEVVKLNQSWDDRLEFPPAKIPKRYCSGNLGVVLHLSDERILEGAIEYSALITREMLSDDCLHGCKGNFNGAAGEAQDEFSVFINDVQILCRINRALSNGSGV